MRDIRVYTNAFFDSKRVIAATKRAQRKSLSRAGAYVRTRSRSLIGNKVSAKTKPRAPGKPPRNRKGQLKRFIFFAYDFQRDSVFVGPALLPRGKGNGLVLTSTTVPETLEFGGRGRRRKPTGKRAQPTTAKQYGYAKHGLGLDVTRDMTRGDVGELIGASLRGDSLPNLKQTSVAIPARPFMNPALEIEAREGTIAKAFENSITA